MWGARCSPSFSARSELQQRKIKVFFSGLIFYKIRSQIQPVLLHSIWIEDLDMLVSWAGLILCRKLGKYGIIQLVYNKLRDKNGKISKLKKNNFFLKIMSKVGKIWKKSSYVKKSWGWKLKSQCLSVWYARLSVLVVFWEFLKVTLAPSREEMVLKIQQD